MRWTSRFCSFHRFKYESSAFGCNSTGWSPGVALLKRPLSNSYALANLADDLNGRRRIRPLEGILAHE